MTTRDTVHEFDVLLEPDEDGFVIWCPSLLGCQSFGLTREEAIENIKEAIALYLENEAEVPHPEHQRVAVNLG
jgi:predicted RNase H-like HicB family nuclease